ncbi:MULTISPECIES: hypothetical protein [Thermomonospora]|uniref:Uncharacterized protein n=1 Tax=Thermomonospora cellulosilytica TaxID=1411118 RepID=A0A7W3RC64_9ACTN|nr:MULTISPECIES: hypothetical protein [Thermomonospora]MBA9007514.1 hypothetical protein [Thermomonospora cellulosilytica]
MSVWSAHCALRRRFGRGDQCRSTRHGGGCPGVVGGDLGRSAHGEPFGRPAHPPRAVRAAAGAVRWERPHEQERRRRRLIGGA